MAQVCLSSTEKGLSCSYPKVCQVSISSFGSVPNSMGPLQLQCYKSHQPRSSHTSMEFCRKSPQPSCFQLGNWNSNPPSFPTVNNHTGFLPHRPTPALGSLSSTHQGRHRGLHKLCCTMCNKNDSGYKQTFFFPPVSEQKLHFPQLIQCYWSTLLPHKNHI